MNNEFEKPYIVLTMIDGSSFAQVDRFDTPEEAVAFKKRYAFRLVNTAHSFIIQALKAEPIVEE